MRWGRYPVEGLSFQSFSGQMTIQRRARDEQTREDWLHSSQIKWGKCIEGETFRQLKRRPLRRKGLTAYEFEREALSCCMVCDDVGWTTTQGSLDGRFWQDEDLQVTRVIDKMIPTNTLVHFGLYFISSGVCISSGNVDMTLAYLVQYAYPYSHDKSYNCNSWHHKIHKMTHKDNKQHH